MHNLNYFSLKIFKVITLLIVFGLFYCNIIYATPHYVDKNAAGLNNGTSWTNAWKSFSVINWGSIQPGDIVYISGGTDSLQYNEVLTVGANGTAANPITIIAGKYSPSSSGYSGRVIIDGGGVRDQSIQIRANSPGRKYIIIKGFELRRAVMGVNIEDYASNIILDSLNIYDFRGQAGLCLMVQALIRLTTRL